MHYGSRRGAGVLMGRGGALLLSLPLVLAACAAPLTPLSQTAITTVQTTRAEAQAAAERLSKAIQFRTISFEDKPTDNAAFEAFHVFLRNSFPRVHTTLKLEKIAGQSLLFTWEGLDPKLAPILLTAHQDVVPAGGPDLGDWTHPPFDGLILDGLVWGRGALDNKGQMLATLESVEALLRDGFAPQRTVLLGFGHDEETHGAGAKAIAARLQEQGVAPEFVMDEGLLILDPFPITGKPAGFIGVSEKGYGNLEVVATDRAAHASTPPRRPAAARLSEAILAITNMPLPRRLDPMMQTMLGELAPDMGGMQKTAMENLWLFEPFVREELSKEPAGEALMGTTVAPTMLTASSKENVLPERATAIFNVRLHPADTPEFVLKLAQDAVKDIPNVTVAWKSPPASAAPVSSSSSRAFRLIQAHARELHPARPRIAPALVMGATDARAYLGVAQDIYRFQPIVLTAQEAETIHGVDERISIENIGRMIAFYKGFIRDAAGR